MGGELTVTVKSRWAIDYEITPPAGEDREVYIEEPRQNGWKPAGEAKDFEENASRVRFRVDAPKGKTTKATFAREHIDSETISLVSLAPDQIYATVSGLQNDTPALKEAVAKLGAVVGDIAKIAARKTALDAERDKIGSDQDRIRQNLASVGQASDLGRRYIETLKSQEDRIAAIETEEKKLDEGRAAKTKKAEEIAQALVL